MSFRIDDAYEAAPGQWTFELQGLYGLPLFAALCTGADGRGLKVAVEFHAELAWLRRSAAPQAAAQVVAPSRFVVPWGADDREAVRLLISALEALGWGRGVACATRFPRLGRKADSLSGGRVDPSRVVP